MQALAAAGGEFGVTRGVATLNGPERAPVSPDARSGFARIRLGGADTRSGWTIHVRKALPGGV